jgi:hypothetical protein
MGWAGRCQAHKSEGSRLRPSRQASTFTGQRVRSLPAGNGWLGPIWAFPVSACCGRCPSCSSTRPSDRNHLGIQRGLARAAAFLPRAPGGPLAERAERSLNSGSFRTRSCWSRPSRRPQDRSLFVPGGLDPAVGTLEVRDAELVDMAVEGFGDAAHMPSDAKRQLNSDRWEAYRVHLSDTGPFGEGAHIAGDL